MNDITLHSKIKDYQVHFTTNFNFLGTLHDVQPRAVIVDKNVFHLYVDLFHTSFHDEEIILFDAVEANKTIESCLNLYEQIIKKASKKNITIISAGGGITQDVTGFVASTLYRGVKWIYLPTTFLAQTDSCIGSKTSLNFKSYKNLVGTFYPPEHIFIDTGFLQTLSDLDFYSGIGETIKLQLMKEGGPKDIGYIKSTIDRSRKKDGYLIELIRDNMYVKISYMENDEFDQGRRNLLNYGHCFGHALETSSNYHIPHGIAVLIGILFANMLSRNRGILSDKYVQELLDMLVLPNIPLKLDRSYFDDGPLLQSMKQDKKKIGKLLTVVIPDQDKNVIKVDNVTDQEVRECVEELRRRLLISEVHHE